MVLALPLWVSLLQALLTPAIGITTVYIAWQQWQANRLKLMLDRYDRRLRIYEQVIAVLLLTMRDFNPDATELQKFRAATAEADFLFGPEISEYLDEILRRGLNLRAAYRKYRDATQSIPPGYDHEKVVNDMTEQERWFTDQFGAAKEKFRRYLNVSR